MGFDKYNFIVAIVAMSMAAWVITTFIRARHGYPITDDNGNTVMPTDPQASRKVELLSSENERLTGQIGRLEERIAVLERIVTDAHAPARLDREIESLR